jgi:predicted nucleic acid-binding protein
MTVADTDVLIDYLRGHGEVAEQVAEALVKGLQTTAVTAFELWAGSVGSRRREAAVETLLGAIDILPLDAAAARRAAAVRRQLELAGRSIGMADSLIAGICLQHGAMLMTRNRGHYERVPGLVLSPG